MWTLQFQCKVGIFIAYLSIYLFYLWVLHHFQHCTGHITTGSWKGRGNQYIQFIRVLYCKLPTNGNQLPAFPLEAVPGIEPRPQRWEARVLALCHRGPPLLTYLFGVLCRFQHCTGHITMGSWKGRGNQYIQLVKVLYCKLPIAYLYMDVSQVKNA